MKKRVRKLKFFVKLSKGVSTKYIRRGISFINLKSLKIFLASEIFAKKYKKKTYTWKIYKNFFLFWTMSEEF